MAKSKNTDTTMYNIHSVNAWEIACQAFVNLSWEVGESAPLDLSQDDHLGSVPYSLDSRKVEEAACKISKDYTYRTGGKKCSDRNGGKKYSDALVNVEFTSTIDTDLCRKLCAKIFSEDSEHRVQRDQLKAFLSDQFTSDMEPIMESFGDELRATIKKKDPKAVWEGPFFSASGECGGSKILADAVNAFCSKREKENSSELYEEIRVTNLILLTNLLLIRLDDLKTEYKEWQNVSRARKTKHSGSQLDPDELKKEETKKKRACSLLLKTVLSLYCRIYCETVWRDEINNEFRERQDAEKIGVTGKYAYPSATDKTEIREILKPDPIRAFVYQKGFCAKIGEKSVAGYSLYKRSASKAKKGDCLFILDPIREEMLEWCWLGKYREALEPMAYSGGEFSKPGMLTSARAYESLVQSSIIGTFELRNPKESILLLDARKSKSISHKHINMRKMIASLDDKNKIIPELTEVGEDEDFTNTVWDGQALLDKSVFDEYKMKYGIKDDLGMMTLRNHFFKACAFNTNIQEFFRENLKDGVVKDAYGRELHADKIRMIITKDSLKWLKFAEDFYPEEKNPEKKAYTEWLKKISTRVREKTDKKGKTAGREKSVEGYSTTEFGVTKTDERKFSPTGDFHKASYQLLNTLPLSKEAVVEMMKPDIDYVELLKKDPSVRLFNMRYMESSETDRVHYYLYKWYGEKYNCAHFQAALERSVESYIRNMKRGKIHIDSEFKTLCSMPYEMLQYSLMSPKERQETERQETERQDSSSKFSFTLAYNEAYIEGAEEDRFTIIRYPHLNSGSVCVLENLKSKKKRETIRKWFNLTDRIIVISTEQSNLMKRLGGADFDSDTVLLCRDVHIQDAAEKLMQIPGLNEEGKEISEGLAVSYVDEKDPLLKKETGHEKLALDPGQRYFNCYAKPGMALIDTRLANNEIGVISNNIQVYNSKIWETFFDENLNSDDKSRKIRSLYEAVLKLSALNEIEIDKGKHAVSISTTSIIKTIEKQCIDDLFPNGMNMDFNHVGRFIKEELFPTRSRFKLDKNLCRSPLDYIGENCPDKKIPPLSSETKQSLARFILGLDRIANVNTKAVNYDQVNEILSRLYETAVSIKKLNYEIKRNKGKRSGRELTLRRKGLISDFVAFRSNKTINPSTAAVMIRLAMEKSGGEKSKPDESAATGELNKIKECLRAFNEKAILISLLIQGGTMKPVPSADGSKTENSVKEDNVFLSCLLPERENAKPAIPDLVRCLPGEKADLEMFGMGFKYSDETCDVAGFFDDEDSEECSDDEIEEEPTEME
ncbi:MAG: hypothetical protein J5750_02050 [Clostridiales bacterium]|nr:hypothetical protein [Clostridiales bacterium]